MVAFARREGWTLVAPPRIDLQRDDDLRVGEFGIATSHVEAPSTRRRPRRGAGAGAVPRALPAGWPAAGGHAAGSSRCRRGRSRTRRSSTRRPRPPPPAAPRRSAARAALRGPQGEWELREAVTVLGRSRRCGIVLTDPNVSREHAEVRRQGDGFMLRDLGSTNGTRLNRRDVKQAVLQHGDRIELGTTELVFERLP